MNIWVYAVMFNEELILPYFLRHYAPICDRLMIYEHDCTDKTVEIARTCKKVELRSFTGSPGIMDEIKFIGLANQEWKEARGKADWIIWVDADEFIYHPDLRGYLHTCLNNGVTLPKMRGFSMIGSGVPTTSGQIYDEINVGVEDPLYAKRAVFSPSLDEIGYKPGKHVCNPRGNIAEDEPGELTLLHYRYFDRTSFMERNRRQYERQNSISRVNNWGLQCRPDYTGKYSAGWYELMRKEAFNVLTA